jgi:hypothetical protein
MPIRGLYDYLGFQIAKNFRDNSPFTLEEYFWQVL